MHCVSWLAATGQDSLVPTPPTGSHRPFTFVHKTECASNPPKNSRPTDICWICRFEFWTYHFEVRKWYLFSERNNSKVQKRPRNSCRSKVAVDIPFHIDFTCVSYCQSSRRAAEYSEIKCWHPVPTAHYAHTFWTHILKSHRATQIQILLRNPKSFSGHASPEKHSHVDCFHWKAHTVIESVRNQFKLTSSRFALPPPLSLSVSQSLSLSVSQSLSLSVSQSRILSVSQSRCLAASPSFSFSFISRFSPRSI